MTLVVYNQNGSPPCGFIRMLAKHLGLDVKLHDLNLLEGEHLTPDYLKASPNSALYLLCWGAERKVAITLLYVVPSYVRPQPTPRTIPSSLALCTQCGAK